MDFYTHMPLFFKIQTILWFSYFISLIPLFFVYRFWFFLRDPKRKIPEGNNIVAPADGLIIYIKEIKNNKEIPISIKKDKQISLNELMDDAENKYNLVIGIFMTPFSVHYNRFPFSGTITKNFYRSTKNNKTMLKSFLSLVFNLKPFTENADYILDNERNTIALENDKIDGAVVQIASTWIDNIKNLPVEIGDKVNKGDKIGIIRMGSQCDLYLNIKSNYKILVKERSYVKAGSSVLIEVEE
jgi:phosphatidylserine decarboxylase